MSSPKTRTLLDRVLLRLGFLSYEQWNHNFHIDDCFDDKILDVCRELQLKHHFDTVLVEYIFMTKAFNAFSGEIKKIVDTHDCFTDRYGIYPLVNGKRPYRWFSTYRKDEKKGLNRAHSIIAIQDEEASYFRKLSDREVLTVGHLFEESVKEPAGHFRGETVLFFASDNVINVDAYRYFTNEVWPLVLQLLPNSRLIVAGRICNAIERVEHVDYLGEVADVRDAYQMATVSINPMQYGSGLKIKTLESLIMGVPVVSTLHGAIGLEKMISQCVFVAVDATDFSRKIVHLLTDKIFYTEVELSLQKCLEEYQSANNEAIYRLFGSLKKK